MEWCSHCLSYVDPRLAVTKSMKHVLRQCPRCGKILPGYEIEVPDVTKRRSMAIGEKNRRTPKPKLRKTDDADGVS